MSPQDFLTIVAIALGSALTVGALGLAALHLLRYRPLIFQICVVALASGLALAAGVIAVASAMYISAHDLLVVVTVTTVSAVVSMGTAVLLGLRIARSADYVRALAHTVGDGMLVTTKPDHVASGAEFDTLTAELAATSRRLAQARAEVQAIDASRREFVAWISHDLRSPLSGLRVMTEALEDRVAEDPSRFHHQMRLQVERLTALVDNLFELSKIQSGTLSLQMEPLSLHDLVSDAVAEISSVAHARKIELRAHTNPNHTLVGDARELSRVVSNLLMNALEHTPAGGVITISTMQDTDRVSLSVRDSGTGIAEEDLTRIFSSGWRGSRARATHDSVDGTSGAGLGLAIVRGIVEAHRGRIIARNEPIGCRFDVWLPTATSEPSP